MKWRSAFCLVFISFLANGQNIIPNPSFEEVFTELEYQWVQPQGPFYHLEKTDSTSLHQAHTGDYVNGLCMYNNRENEFLHIRLLEPLEAGVAYQLKIQAQLMSAKCFNDHIQKLIGVHFGKESLDTHIPGDLYLKPQVNLQLPDSNRFDWFELTDTYTAQGGEEYLTIGYFAATQTEEIRRSEKFVAAPEAEDSSDKLEVDNSWLYLPPDEQNKYIKAQKKKFKKRKKGALNSEAIPDFSKPESTWENSRETGKDPNSLYFMVRYYFDDFCLAPIFEDHEIDCAPSTPPIILEKGRSIALRNVFFETDEAELLDESIVQLNGLNRILLDYPDMKIELRGYTDDRGKSAYNLSLSQKRATAVKAWLIEQGLTETRVGAKGFGEKDPIESNSTEAGRARNRRVEFFIVKM
ncbi:MAG: outer membrane protein OmpA-like peptidoglycan-associated protein [Cryomorphaceae bacterium]|jgi:outer membrane protein OmpA-like peptidoglycan-associated protein